MKLYVAKLLAKSTSQKELFYKAMEKEIQSGDAKLAIKALDKWDDPRAASLVAECLYSSDLQTVELAVKLRLKWGNTQHAGRGVRILF